MAAFALAAPGVPAVAYLALEGSVRRVALVVTVLACLLGAGIGVAVNRPVRPRVWDLLLGGWALLGAADVLSAVAGALAGDDRQPLAAGLLRVAGFALLCTGLLRLAGGRHPTRERGALLDATLVGTAAATVAGAFLILPRADEIDGLAWAGAVLGPLAGAAVLAALTRLVTTRGARTPAFHLLAASVVAAVVGACFGLPALGLAGYVLLALAALHPSVRALAESARGGGDRLTGARLGALGAAMLLTPATLLVQSASGGARHLPLVAIGSTGVIVLVLVRIRGLLREVEAQAAQLSRMARADGLTGLPNRRSWDFELARAAARARENGERLAVAILDLDHFKAFNDSRGHQAGDELLRTAAAAWREALGRTGTLARYGGEEFALALVGAGVPEAVALLGRLAAVTPSGQTFSAGVAVWDFLEDPAEAVARADAALYEAKRGGRNRVVASGPAAAGTPADDASRVDRPNG